MLFKILVLALSALGMTFPLHWAGSQPPSFCAAKHWNQPCKDSGWGWKWSVPRGAFQSLPWQFSWFANVPFRQIILLLVFKNAGKAVVTSECNTCSLNPFCIYLGHFLPFLSLAWLQLILCPGYLLIPTATFDPWKVTVWFVLVHMLWHVNVLVWFSFPCPEFKAYNVHPSACLVHYCLSINFPLSGQQLNKI